MTQTDTRIDQQIAASTGLEAAAQNEPTERPLGSTCEIMRRGLDFNLFWRENPRTARFALQTEARSLLPKERVKNCLRVRQKQGEPVDVLYTPGPQAAHYGNLQTCGSVWNCPVCAAKIATRRREELTAGVTNWTGQGNTVLLGTFTLQHLVTDTCAEILKAITDCHFNFWRNRPGQRIKQFYRIVGKIRGLEVTYTANGWHWHFHDLLFISGGFAPNLVDDLRGEGANHWQHVVSKSGRFADSVHGFDLRATDRDVADYVSKLGKEGDGKIPDPPTWTEAHELALAPIKRAARGGLTQFQLLAYSLVGDEQAGRLFVDYALTVKGKSYLHWSRGLRNLVGVEQEKTDEELAAEQDQIATILAQLDKEHWRVILGNAARGELLKAASTGDPWAVLEFLEDLGLDDVHYPGLVNDPNYHGPYRIYEEHEQCD